MDRLEAEVSKINSKLPVTRFKEHGYEVINRLRENLSRAQTSESKRLKQFYLFQVDTGIRWLLIQHGRFKAVLESSTERRWSALLKFVRYFSQRLGLRVSPLPFFGDAYYSSGSFSYYRGLALRLEKEYYVLSFDYTDPPVYWPLALHELAHCWFSNRDDVDQICGRHLPSLRRIDKETAANRVEEALCDAIATRVIGPAYPYAFVSRLWTQFPAEVSFTYPSNRYRIECMATVLDHQGFYERAADLRDVADQKFEDRWQDEDVSWSLDDLRRVTEQLPTPSAKEVERIAHSASIVMDAAAPEDPASLFYAAWLAVNNADPEETAQSTDKVSQVILRILEESSVPSDA